MARQFDKPLDTDLVEEQEVEYTAVVPTGETGADGNPAFKTEQIKERVSIKTRYTKATPHVMSCRDGNHCWEMIDRHKHLAACAHCTKRRFLRAVYEAITPDGHLIDRDTGRIID